MVSVLREQFVEKLQRYYRHEKISVIDFDCPNLNKCADDAGGTLNHGAEAHVGTRYGEATRVAVLSLDTGWSSEDIEARTKTVESARIDSTNPHMRGTIRFLTAILHFEIGESSPIPYITMLNSAKCAINNNGMDKVPDSLHQRCRDFAVGELDILRPALLWLQGSTVRWQTCAGHVYDYPDLESAIESFLSRHSQSAAELVRWILPIANRYIGIFKCGDWEIPVIITPHPSDRFGRWHLFEQTVMPIVADLAIDLAGSVNHR